MYLLFKANGSFKYGCGILETIIQSYVLPTDLSTRLIWNRFFNAYNKPDTNIPLDLQVSSFESPRCYLIQSAATNGKQVPCLQTSNHYLTRLENRVSQLNDHSLSCPLLNLMLYIHYFCILTART